MISRLEIARSYFDYDPDETLQLLQQELQTINEFMMASAEKLAVSSVSPFQGFRQGDANPGRRVGRCRTALPWASM